MSKREEGPPPLAPGGAAWESVGAARENAAFSLQRRVVWPIEDTYERIGPRAAIGIFGGGGVAVAGVVAALLIANPGAGSGDAAPEAMATIPSHAATIPAATPAPKKKAAKPGAPTLHGASPSFEPAKSAKVGVGDAQALGGADASTAKGDAPVQRGAASANETPASTAKIGSTASAESTVGANTAVAGTELLAGPPAPQAAKHVARNFAEAFVLYETGRTDAGVRAAFGRTTTKQLSQTLLHRPPRQPADVKVPQAKVVNVVAGPSEGGLYSVSVSLLRVGVTSELRLEMQQGPDKKWQVTNVLG